MIPLLKERCIVYMLLIGLYDFVNYFLDKVENMFWLQVGFKIWCE